MARSTMARLIYRVRLLVNDPLSATPQFSDDDIQDVLDEGREDIVNMPLIPKPVYSGASIQFLDYYTELGGWEDDMVIKQFLINPVTPSMIEPIAGHFQFAQSTLPPLVVTGKLHDVYRAAADLLERWSARYVMAYNVNVDGQSLQRSQIAAAMLTLAKQYRQKQRAHTITMNVSHLGGQGHNLSLQPTEIDYMGSGSGT